MQLTHRILKIILKIIITQATNIMFEITKKKMIINIVMKLINGKQLNIKKIINRIIIQI